MAFLKFNKAELVNLEYSLRREILSSNKDGAYCNTSIIGCNTRKYHGLLVVPIPGFDEEKYVLLSALDESVILNYKQFNLGIHCYGDVYEPKGHKYIIDFDADALPVLLYKVGPVTLSKSVTMSPDSDRVLIKYRIISAPGRITLNLKPFLAFRGVHSLTAENPAARQDFEPVENGVSFCMYPGFPSLFIQTGVKSEYRHQPYWYKGIVYSDEYRRGYDCREDLLVPGSISVNVKEGDEVIVCAGTSPAAPRTLKAEFSKIEKSTSNVGTHKDILLRNADRLKVLSGGKKMICAGYSWLKTGLLRETLLSLTGLTLYANGDRKEFEEILDNLIEAEKDRLYRKTTQIEAPLLLADVLQQYIAFGAPEKAVWKKYGTVLKNVIESYSRREEVSINVNGLLWCQKPGVALSWMNTYCYGSPVTERAGFQVETNALWYNALCFALDMEKRCGGAKGEFVKNWESVAIMVKNSFRDTFVVKNSRGYYTLADYVDNAGQHKECRPNMMWAVYIPYPLLDEEVQADIMSAMASELVTRRGIRTLSPRSIDYHGMYDGPQTERDLAQYNGCTHTLLTGPYVDVCFRMIGSSFCGKAKWLTEGFFEDINRHGVGSFSELYDADPPHEPHGAISSATATAALLRCVYLMDKYSKEEAK